MDGVQGMSSSMVMSPLLTYVFVLFIRGWFLGGAAVHQRLRSRDEPSHLMHSTGVMGNAGSSGAGIPTEKA